MEIAFVWGLVFKTRPYLKGSLWFLPLLGGIAGAVLGALEAPLSRTIGVPSAVKDELDRLDAEVAREFGPSPDLERANEPDRQGLGRAPGLGGRAALIER
jgi:hypothetical protein